MYNFVISIDAYGVWVGGASMEAWKSCFFHGIKIAYIDIIYTRISIFGKDFIFPTKPATWSVI